MPRAAEIREAVRRREGEEGAVARRRSLPAGGAAPLMSAHRRLPFCRECPPLSGATLVQAAAEQVAGFARNELRGAADDARDQRSLYKATSASKATESP
eukprot:364912-Chlamydomonas_euryale.AAC.15